MRDFIHIFHVMSLYLLRFSASLSLSRCVYNFFHLLFYFLCSVLMPFAIHFTFDLVTFVNMSMDDGNQLVLICTAYWCVIEEQQQQQHSTNNDINHFRACHTNKIKRVHILLPSIAFQFIYMSVCLFGCDGVSVCLCDMNEWMNDLSYILTRNSVSVPHTIYSHKNQTNWIMFNNCKRLVSGRARAHTAICTPKNPITFCIEWNCIISEW